MPDPIDYVETKFLVLYRYVSLQTSAEETASEHIDADILYASFELYYADAVDELANILNARGIELTVNQERTALTHLIADYYEMGNPDWSYKSESMSPGVSFSRGEDTSARLALNKLLDQVEKATKRTRVTRISKTQDDVKQVRDSEIYPDRFKLSDIPVPNVVTGDYTGSSSDLSGWMP